MSGPSLSAPTVTFLELPRPLSELDAVLARLPSLNASEDRSTAAAETRRRWLKTGGSTWFRSCSVQRRRSRWQPEKSAGACAAWRDVGRWQAFAGWLHQVQDGAIRDAVAMQEMLGFRLSPTASFVAAAGRADFSMPSKVSNSAPRSSRFGAMRDSRRHRRRRLLPSRFGAHQPDRQEDFKFSNRSRKSASKSRCRRRRTCILGNLRRRSIRNVYPNVELYWNDMVAVFQQEIKDLYAAGCRYLQLDEVPLALLCDNNISALAKREGDDPDKLVSRLCRRAQSRHCRPARRHDDRYALVPRQHGKPVDGGRRLRADRRSFFTRCDVDAYLLEYDSGRAGDFAPLRHLPASKRAYLGIISTKNPDTRNVR